MSGRAVIVFVECFLGVKNRGDGACDSVEHAHETGMIVEQDLSRGLWSRDYSGVRLNSEILMPQI